MKDMSAVQSAWPSQLLHIFSNLLLVRQLLFSHLSLVSRKTVTRLQYSMSTNCNLIARTGHLTCVAESMIENCRAFDSGSPRPFYYVHLITAIILGESTVIHADN